MSAHGTPVTPPKPQPGCAECRRLTAGIEAALATIFPWQREGILKALLDPPPKTNA